MSGEFKCNLCGRKYKKSTLWILEHLGFKNLYLCDECDLCFNCFDDLNKAIKELSK